MYYCVTGGSTILVFIVLNEGWFSPYTAKTLSIDRTTNLFFFIADFHGILEAISSNFTV